MKSGNKKDQNMKTEQIQNIAEHVVSSFEFQTDDEKETVAWGAADGFTAAAIIAALDAIAAAACDDVEEMEEMLNETALEIARSQVREAIQKREDLEHAEWKKGSDKRDEIKAAVEAALGVQFRGRGPSVYAYYGEIKLRVSDHDQVSGGGYSMESDERMGEADLQWVVEIPDAEFHPVPSRAEIRKEVATALRAARQAA